MADVEAATGQLGGLGMENGGAGGDERASTSEKYSARVLVKTIIGREDGGVGLLGQRITVGGWVKTGRSSPAINFLELNDGSCPANLQVRCVFSVVVAAHH